MTWLMRRWLVGKTRRGRRALLVSRLLEAGTGGYPPKIRRRLKILNVMAYLIAVFSGFYALVYALEDLSTYRWIVAINFGLLLVGLCAPLAHRLHELAGGSLIAVAELAALFALVGVLGRESGIQINLLVGAAAPFVIFGLGRPALVVAVVAISLALHLAAWFLFPQERAMLASDGDLLAQLYVSSAVTAFAVIAALVYYAFRLAEEAEAETEALLRNILPDTIVERLRTRPEAAIADSFVEASVLFSDLQGFVPLAKSLGAARTVAMLNELVRAFDGLSTQHGVEKIKTIGDAYMAVAGLPDRAPDHAARLARMALDMLEVARDLSARLDIDLRLRIGIACGPVMAGVIGVRKFSYDVWGDPVNLAARLESSGEAGRVQVSVDVRTKLADAFEFVPRGMIEIKGVGRQETWFLIGPSR